ncbi:MAG: GNAT family N-acetyltransferase, partial [Candidatus Sericytochromatia bacterium]
PYYDMYEMRCRRPGDQMNHCPDARAVPLEPADFDAYYELLCKAFRHNPDVSISDPESAREAWMNSSGHSRIWLIWEQDRPVAFLNVMIEGLTGEIRTLGVDPEARGQGLGRALLGHALAWLKLHHKASCGLSVAVQNAKALGLYRSMGFEVVEHSACWKWEAPILI